MRSIENVKRLVILLTPPILLHTYNNFKNNEKRFIKSNKVHLSNFKQNFEVVEFSFIDSNSKYDLKWSWWSRVFEYELALNYLKNLGASKQTYIHNTCWGYHGSHILFKDELEKISNHVTNSDLISSQIRNTQIHDIRKPVPEGWKNHFDFVINISTIEEIAYSHICIIENLLEMVAPGGHLIVTFDLPGLQLEDVEKLFDREIKNVVSPITGTNSPYVMPEFAELKSGFFVLKKVSFEN